jgi:hypothetical protein
MKYFLNDSNCVFFYSKNRNEIGIGNILIIEYIGENKNIKGKFAVVEKIAKKNYEFSGKLVFPGGMTRCDDCQELESFTDNIKELQKKSLISRVNSEIGIREIDILDLKQILLEKEFYTKYTTPGDKIQRFTKISVWHCTTYNEKIKTKDLSVDKPKWIGINDLIDNLNWGPANLYILGEYLQLKNQYESIPDKIKHEINVAKQFCLKVKKETQK